MIENKQTVLEDNSDMHSDILYAVLMAINVNISANKLNAAEQEGQKVDNNTIQALSTSVQLPNVLSMAAALTLCARTLIVNNTIDFNSQFDAMWNSHPLIHEQMEKAQCKEFFTMTLDIPNTESIIQ